MAATGQDRTVMVLDLLPLFVAVGLASPGAEFSTTLSGHLSNGTEPVNDLR